MKHQFLIVDDENEILKLVHQLLTKNFDCEIKAASSGEEGFVYAMNNQLSLIILDHRMPVLTGAELFHKIRNESEKNRNTPVIFLSAYIDEIVLDKNGVNLEDLYFLDKTQLPTKLIPYLKMILGQ